MTWLNLALNNFIGGEVSSDVYRRFDIDIYKKSLEALINYMVRAQGPVFYRPGFRYVTNTRLNKFAVLKKFIFSTDESYILEFTDQKLRFYRNQAPVTEAEKEITGVTTGAQTVVTANAHGYNDGDEVYIYDIEGLTFLNGKSFIVADKTDDSFALKNQDDEYVSTEGQPAYVSGGVASRVYELDVPYEEAKDLGSIQVAQNADTMYIVHPKYQPQKLTRTNDTDWKITAASGQNYPFTSEGNYPRAVAFAQGRLWYGGTEKAPDKFWGSKGPKDDGTPQFDDFTTGTGEDNAVVFLMSTAGGRVEDIQWIGSNNKYLVIGTFGGVSRVTGASEDSAISPASVNVRQMSAYGAYKSAPVLMGNSIYYIQRNELATQEVYYDLYQDSYISETKNLLSAKITGDGIRQLEVTNGRVDILWARRNDGTLLGMSVNKAQNVSAWHRQILGGSVKVESMSAIPQPQWDDQLWVVANTTIGGKTRRFVQFMSNEVLFPEKLDFFTGNEDEDQKHYDNAIFEKQLKYTHLDSFASYDGANPGVKDEITLTISADDGSGKATITADKETFEDDIVGCEIWGVYDSRGVGGGRYLITKWVSATELECEVLSSTPEAKLTLAPGEWRITSDTISGLDYLEGETVQVIVDGGVHPDVTVKNGMVKLEAQHSVVHIGYGYLGILKSLNIEGGGINGPAQCKPKRITDLGVGFLNTLGAEVGSDIYNMEQVLYASTDQYTGRPPQPFSGIKKIPIRDEWVGKTADDTQTQVVVVQKYALPCEIQMIDVIFETTNE